MLFFEKDKTALQWKAVPESITHITLAEYPAQFHVGQRLPLHSAAKYKPPHSLAQCVRSKSQGFHLYSSTSATQSMRRHFYRRSTTMLVLAR